MDVASLITLFICVLVIFLYIRTHYPYRIYELFDNLSEDKEIPHLITRTKEPPVSNIPADVYMSWKSHTVPPKMYEVIMENIRANPEFNFHIYSDEECRKYIQDNYDADVLNAFDMLKPGAYKSDLWRYCILYKKGGIYIDIKFKVFNTLREFLEKNETVFVKDLTKHNVYQGILIAKPGEPIFLQAIRRIIKHCAEKYYGTDTLDPTGPGLIGNLLEEQGLKHMIKLYNERNPTEINQYRINVYYYSDKNKEKLLFQDYNEYRQEQKKYTSTQPHYNDAWHAHDIYASSSSHTPPV